MIEIPTTTLTTTRSKPNVIATRGTTSRRASARDACHDRRAKFKTEIPRIVRASPHASLTRERFSKSSASSSDTRARGARAPRRRPHPRRRRAPGARFHARGKRAAGRSPPPPRRSRAAPHSAPGFDAVVLRRSCRHALATANTDPRACCPRSVAMHRVSIATDVKCRL